MPEIFKKINQRLKQTTNTILLNIAYFFGIGLTAIVAKFVGKHFLSRVSDRSNWNDFPEPTADTEMF